MSRLFDPEQEPRHRSRASSDSRGAHEPDPFDGPGTAAAGTGLGSVLTAALAGLVLGALGVMFQVLRGRR